MLRSRAAQGSLPQASTQLRPEITFQCSQKKETLGKKAWPILGTLQDSAKTFHLDLQDSDKHWGLSHRKWGFLALIQQPSTSRLQDQIPASIAVQQPSKQWRHGTPGQASSSRTSPTGANPQQKVSRESCVHCSHSVMKRTQYMPAHGCTEVTTASEESGTELVNNQFSVCPAWTGLRLCLHSKGMSHKDDRHRTTKTCHLSSNRKGLGLSYP